MMHPLIPVILCGGSGTRLWPLSRETYPKQFLALTDERTMLQHAVTRLDGLTDRVPQAHTPLLVCNEQHRFILASQLVDIGINNFSILLEPSGRNTAPALTLAALHSCSKSYDPVLLAMPADHVIVDLPAFHAAVETAYAVAREGCVMTFGVVADRPETGYGYIQCGIAMGSGVHQVNGFKEKPDAERAADYLKAGNYLWNSGLFMLRASVWLRALESCRPDILRACRESMEGARHDLDFIRPAADAFLRCPSDSIDYAVMERLMSEPGIGIETRVVRMNAGWSDIGVWDALLDLHVRDEDGNSLMGDVVQHGCKDSLLFSNSRLIAGVGLDNVIVVETPDAVLVANKQRSQDVKQIVTLLSNESRALVHTHRKVHRPWGWYDSIDSGENFQVKRIVVNPGASLSLQLHQHRAEHWVVVKGMAEVTCEEKIFRLQKNESTFIPIGCKHRLKNPADFPLEIIEVQSGSYLGEDDIVRIDDVYGRSGF